MREVCPGDLLINQMGRKKLASNVTFRDHSWVYSPSDIHNSVAPWFVVSVIPTANAGSFYVISPITLGWYLHTEDLPSEFIARAVEQVEMRHETDQERL